ncbi:activator of Hsp90 ATPase [Lipomyces oligophaga]|uniref:activator of Hsp90 ATPase n=1 Tax=Lipomyces oligophaga TaxID=45792 RepID=UPI0034D02123
MVVHNPNNWHWVDKNCVEWAKAYFKERIVGTSASTDSAFAEISDLTSLTGDVDVNQRKGKVISLFDLQLVFSYKGQVGDTLVDGSISIPEVAYDTEEEEYVFDISITGETKEKLPIKLFLREYLVPKLRQKLAIFGHDLLETHGKDIQHPVSENNSEFTKSAQIAQTSVKPSKTTSNQTSSSHGQNTAYNTTTLHMEPVFNTSAAELYETFMNIDRVAAWTRSRPIIFEPKVDGFFSLFGGNVSGKFLVLTENKSIAMTWRLRDWKDDHFAQLKIVLDQGASETRAIVSWTGVPIGQEDITRQNFEEYYVKSIKLTFGFGAVL